MIHPLSDIQTKQIGIHTRIWQYCVILPKAVIGDHCNICSHCFIENDVVIGNHVTIKSGVQLWDGLRVGHHVFIGPNVSFTNDKYPRSGNSDFTIFTTTIEDEVCIGAGAVILPGLTLGCGAVIGAGSVVTKNVPAGTTVAGNPAIALKRKEN
jgi:acetyltransferase-like isoleucine patch superfamily enzyme